MTDKYHFENWLTEQVSEAFDKAFDKIDVKGKTVKPHQKPKAGEFRELSAEEQREIDDYFKSLNGRKNMGI